MTEISGSTGNGAFKPGSGTNAQVPKMARNAGSDEGKITIPSWAVKMLQWGGPAILAIVAAYYKIDYLEKDLTDLRTQFTAKTECIDRVKSDVAILQERLNGYNDKIGTSLTAMNEQLKTLNTELSNLRTLIMRTSTRETPR